MTDILAPDQKAPHARTWEKKGSYVEDEVLAFANREYGRDKPMLPLPPMLMLHRIVEIRENGDGSGFAAAEYDIRPDNFFFPFHFKGYPVLPGCMGIDGVWQLTGFYLGWLGACGVGMAIGLGSAKFRGAVIPTTNVVRFEIQVLRARLSSKLSRVTATAQVLADGKEIYTFEDVAVGVVPQA